MSLQPIEVLMRNVNKREDGCWEWTARRSPRGYGNVSLWQGVGSGYRYYRAHRLSYELLVGPIPEGLQLDHLCRNRACVNPEHLEAVDCRTNLLRGQTRAAANAAKTHCPRNHPYSAENTYIEPKAGGRQCRICRRETTARSRARRKVAA